MVTKLFEAFPAHDALVPRYRPQYDVNAVLGRQSVNDSGRIIGNWGIQSRNVSGVQFSAWLHLNHSDGVKHNAQETLMPSGDSPVMEHRGTEAD